MARNQPIIYRQQQRRLPPPERVFFYGMGLVAVGGALYFAREYFLDRQASSDTYSPDSGTNSGNSGGGIFSKKKTPSQLGFPLKKGSSGAKVTQLQQALSRIIGTVAMQKNGGVDGKFGPGTENALRQAGFPIIVDEATFSRITAGNAGATVISAPRTIAVSLHTAALQRNLSKVISVLGQMRSVADYSSLNKEYQDLTDQLTFVRKTIVTHLLDDAFKSDISAKDRIKAEFLRIGLKLNGETGKWSLEGLKQHQDIVTTKKTVALDKAGNRYTIPENTILGEVLYTLNGCTWFRSIDGFTAAVPSHTVRPVR